MMLNSKDRSLFERTLSSAMVMCMYTIGIGIATCSIEDFEIGRKINNVLNLSQQNVYSTEDKMDDSKEGNFDFKHYEKKQNVKIGDLPLKITAKYGEEYVESKLDVDTKVREFKE